MRKFLSVLLAMAMVLSLTVTSFAADTAAKAHEHAVFDVYATEVSI